MITRITLLVVASVLATPTAGVAVSPSARYLNMNGTTWMPNNHRVEAPKVPLTDDTIRSAVDSWIIDDGKEKIIQKYGIIGDWDTSQVTDFSHLFTHARWMNEDLSRWNTSRGTTFDYMFAFCNSFRGAPGILNDDKVLQYNNSAAFTLQYWQTSRVTSMRFMFQQATEFDGVGLQNWDVSSVVDMTYMFQGASKFQHSLWRWDTARVIRMNRMFHNATLFSQSLCWYLHPQLIAIQMFCGTNGAKFDPSCDPQGALTNEINGPLHNCCICDYAADDHWYYLDDDAFYQQGNAKDNQLGYILIGLIYSLVFCSIVAVVYVTLRRRHDVQQWVIGKLQTLESTIHNGNRRASNRDDAVATEQLAPDGSAIATLLGPAASATGSNNHTSFPRTEQPDTPLQVTTGSNEGGAILLASDHVQFAQERALGDINVTDPFHLIGTHSIFASWVPDSWVDAAATTVELPLSQAAVSVAQSNAEAPAVHTNAVEDENHVGVS